MNCSRDTEWYNLCLPAPKSCMAIFCVLCWTVQTVAQTITAVHPRTVSPGQSTQLIVLGSDLNDSLRLATDSPDCQWRIEKIENNQATVILDVRQQAVLGPVNLWLSTASGIVKQHTLFIDDLPASTDNGNNHSLDMAQALAKRVSVEGICDSSSSDFYRIQVDSGERIAIEVQTQLLRSPMDPALRILNASGHAIVQVDDSTIGPDIRFSYQFADAGNYWIQVHDSRYAAAGSPYQLRIGDFPIVSQCFPLAIQPGGKQKLRFIGPDADKLPAGEVVLPADTLGTIPVPAKIDGGRSSSWAMVYCSPFPQFTESTNADYLTIPIGINGHLEQPGEVDSYHIRATKGQQIRVSAKTRSLGSPTVLQMKLISSSNAIVSESKVTDADEWSFDATFPEEGNYRLEVSDLLRRGGDEFTYYIECSQPGTFFVSLKAAATTREEFIIEPEHGACAVELQISRFGYDGEIDISLADSQSGLRILNPRIPAKATEAKIFVIADETWKSDGLKVLQFLATATEDSENRCFVDSRGLRRIKEPFVIAPITHSTGTLIMAGTEKTDAPYVLETTAPLQFARAVHQHTVTLVLKRLSESFKAGVELLPSSLPRGWNLASKVEKDNYTLTLNRGDQESDEPASLQLLVYGDATGRGRITNFEVPTGWFDPLKVSMVFSDTLVRGGRVRGVLNVLRQGADSQPVSVTLKELPAGVTGPESVAFAADQAQADFELQISGDAQITEAGKVILAASSKFGDQEFTIESTQILPTIQACPTNLHVHPSEINLTDARDRQQLAITGFDEQSMPRDWTRSARIITANPQIARVQSGVVFPVADGLTDVIIEVGNMRHVLPVRVLNSGVPRGIEFESEVLVALSKQGCNSGACHGSPSGKGGFRLSLRAFDMKFDELTLIREDFGRRSNTLEPENSLLLLKPLMKVSHGGGKQLGRDDVAYAILRDWIASGSKSDPPASPRITSLEIYPSQKQTLSVENGGHQLVVRANFSDGRTRDVTHLAAYETSDTAVATVDIQGFVTPSARGEVAVLVRLLEHIESVSLLFTEKTEGFRWQAPAPSNYVDELVNAKLKQLQYSPAETCSDSDFLRRVSLDLLGILPTIDETSAFLSDTTETKRELLVNTLLEREEYAKFWALQWGDLLKLTSKSVGEEGVYKYYRWLEQSLSDNMPYDQFAQQLLSSSGSTLANPPANFYRTSTDMNECVETISQVFLGARLQCAKCHNHPFERWTQDNYYGLGAFFNRVQRKKTDRPGEWFIYTSDSGNVTQPRTGQVMSPWLPRVGYLQAPSDKDLRVTFTQWMVHPENPYFARIEANRIWSHFFSRGIVEPIDDFRDSNPASNAPLLDALAKDFVESGYDRKHLIRVILCSKTYQAGFQSNQQNDGQSKYFAHQEPRFLGAEQLLDAINRTLALEQKLGGLPAGTLATQMPAPDVAKVDFLKTFGQPERSTVCACERTGDSNLGMAIELFNGSTIHEKLRDPNNRFRKSLAAGKSVDQVIDELYLAAFCRRPSNAELKAALEHCSKNPDPVVGVEDVCWALLNTDEFLFQH